MFFHPYPIPENEPRRGIILLVVITMLTLFSVVAVGFVFYSQSESQASRLFKETEQPFRPDLEPELAMSYFMGQLLYGVENDEVGVQSVLRGHSLARNMFGYNPNQPNVIPFSGTGQVSNPKILNYLYFESDNMVRDPGYSGTRADPNAALGTYIGGLNPSYTYPDENNMFVAAVNTKGEVLKPSFILEEHFDTNDGDWTNNSGKTRILRPRPTDHNGFPQINLGGDVKNLVGGLGIPNPNGGYYNYDSVWLDLGHPVLTGPNGIRYKPLFAPLIMCLDSKIDLNIHGNYRNGTHTSNQGIGVHAVNISRVLSQNNEWQNIFAGGRYGSNNQPNGSLLNYSKFVRTGYKNPPFYSSIDFDGDGSSNYKLPSEPGSYGNHVPFAKFGGNYNNGNGTEQTNHPLRFRYFSPQSDDRLFGLYNMEAILRYRDTGSPFLTSELFQLCPQNFQNSRVRWSVTTLSSDVNMPSAAPWLRSASTNYTLANNADHPTGTAQNLTTSNPRAGEFGAGLNSIVAGLGRLDLNRNLTPYPDVDNDGRMDVSDARTAHEERQEMAGEIFARLVLLTTGVRSEADWPSKNTNPQIYNAFRYLAQLSVNIVDFRDEDHISTVFHWDPNDNDRKDVVYGVELPRVVLSEVYSEVANHPTDQNSNQNAQMPLNVNFWIELLNPLREDNSLIEGGDALLVSNNEPAYRIVILKHAPTRSLTEHDNEKGDFDLDDVKLIVNHFAPAPGFTPKAGMDFKRIKPLHDRTDGVAEENKGYYVLAPNYDFRDGDTNSPLKPTLKIDVGTDADTNKPTGLTYTIPAKNDDLNDLPNHTVLLQKLANPYLAHHDQNNPYITIDFLENIPHSDAVDRLETGVHSADPADGRKSRGRKQPYTAHSSQIVNQSPTNALDGTQHTFFLRNNPNENANWLFQADRHLVSSVELLNVADSPPHQLTQNFVKNNQKFQHLAPWFESQSRLYRLLDCVDTPSRIPGADAAGRFPGRININMLWEDDLDIFKAMCDAGNVSRYTDNTVESIFTAMINKRSPNGKPSANDLPFTGTPGQTSNDSIKNSFLRARTGESPTSTRLFELTNQSHPYRKYELMTRLKNLTTNRSNVFAVWVTVGFFEVKDETTRPMKLGAEIGLQEGRNIRHRMFAIVDRTQIGALNADLGATLSGNVSSTGFQPLQMSKTSGTVQPIDNSNLGTASGKYQWTLHEGMSLVIDKGGQNEEQVIALKDANTGSFFAYFTKTHNSGESLSLPGTPGPVNGSVLGHPGPQPGFDVRNNPRVVPFFTVIN